MGGKRKPRTGARREPEPYQRYRAPLQAKWRPFILARDKGKCRVCASKQELEMAHITDAVAFVRAGGHHRAVTFSYRWDNLVMLCADCHGASHAHHVTQELMERRAQVARLWEQLRKVRGWSSPFAVLPPELVPPELRPRRSFHDTLRLSPLVPFPTFAKYASDGGLVFEDDEAKPLQRPLDDLLGGRAPSSRATESTEATDGVRSLPVQEGGLARPAAATTTSAPSVSSVVAL